MALPTSIPIVAGGDDTATESYNTAIKNALSALTQRVQPNYFALAGQLFDPGKTGSAGEAIGRTATELGRQQAAEESLAPQRALMTAQLAGQQYEVANKAKALKMLGGLMGSELGTTDPAEIQSAIESGSVPASAFAKLTPEKMMMIGSLDNKLGETVFKAGTAAVEREKIRQGELDRNYKLTKELPLKEREVAASELGQRISAGKFGFDIAKLISEQGPGVVSMLNDYVDPALTKGNANKPSTTASVPLPVAGGRISSPFGERLNPFDNKTKEFHSGIDIAGQEGSPVNAIIPGTVSAVGSVGGYGNRVEVKHADGSTSYYAHLKDATVKLGDVIGVNQPIGTLGATGKVTGPHVEFGIQHNGKAIDPLSVLSFAQPQTTQQVNAPNKGPLPAAMPAGIPAAMSGNQASDLEGLPLATQNKVISERIAERDKDWKSHVSELYAATPGVIKNQNDEIEEVLKIAKNNPSVFNILGSGSWWAGLKHAMDEGAKVGKFPISLPVQTFAEYGNLNDQQLKDLRTVQRNLGNIYLASIAERGKVLGSNPTNFEDRLYKTPMASEKDPASVVQEWAAKHLLYNNAKLSMFNAYKPYANNPKLGAHHFFTDDNSPYNTITENYNKFYRQLSGQ
jgi:murein DD-endopeptidase MepM/ murein hydrolase activator NlpD